MRTAQPVTASSRRGILVVGPAWIGDMVMSQPLYRRLRERHPDVAVDVVAPPWSAPLLTRMPEVREALELGTRHGRLDLALRARLARRLRGNYRQAIVLPRSAKAALTPWLARIPLRTGYLGELRFGLLNDIRRDPGTSATARRYLALGAAPGEDPATCELSQPVLAIDRNEQAALRLRLGLDPQAPIAVLGPGAEYGPAKRWPARHFAVLATRLLGAGYRVCILGSASESALGDSIAKASDAQVHNLCGVTTLTETVDLLGLAEVAVVNDSGLMHLAAAAGCRVIALYGSSSPERTPPLTPRATVHAPKLPCSPCFHRVCPYGHYRCLESLRPEAVFESVLAGRERLSQQPT